MSWTFESNPDSSLSTYSNLLDKDTNTKGSFSEDYAVFCKENKIIPCPYISAVSVNSTQECCKVQNGIIDLSSWRAMLLAMSTIGSKIVELSVHSTQITAQHIVDLAKALEKMGICPIVKLQYLYLLINDETTPALVEAFKSLFSDSTCVEYLSLKGSRLGSAVLLPAVSALSNNYKLRCLNLSDNVLTDEVLVELIKSIKFRTNLNEICLSHNTITGKSLSTLTSLFNGMELTAEDEAALKSSSKVLADKNKAIKELNKKRKKAGYPEVAECSPSAECVTASSAKDKKGGSSVLTNRYFNFIDLSHNPMDDGEAVAAFVGSVESSQSSAISNVNGEKIVVSLASSSGGSDAVRSVDYHIAMNTEELLQKVESNPTNSGIYLEVINALRNSADDEGRVQTLREKYLSLFVPTSSFWLEWLHDVKENNDFTSTKDLYIRALDSHPHYSIAIGYITFMSSSYDDDLTTVIEVREAFEKAITLCGSDVVTGSELFKKYIEFELEEHEAVVEEQLNSDPSEKKKYDDAVSRSKQRFVKLFHRQVALPLIGNEQCVAQFDQVLSEYCVASDVKIIDPEGFQRKFTQGLAAREARLTYESHLNSESFETAARESRENSWLTYISFEVKGKEMARAQRLYERAVMDCVDSAALWMEYTEFSFCSLKNHKLVLSVTDRALRAVKRHTALLWKTRLTSLELVERSSSGSGGLSGVQDVVDAEIQRCFTSAGLDNAQDMLELLLLSCEVGLRSIKIAAAVVNQEDQLLSGLYSRLSASFAYCESCLMQWFPQGWEGGMLSLYDMWATAEHSTPGFYEHCRQQEKDQRQQQHQSTQSSSSGRQAVIRGSDVWERAVHSFPQNGSLFLEYIKWSKSRIAAAASTEGERQTDGVELCRRLVKRYVNGKYANSNETDQLREWTSFERQWGTATDVQLAAAKAFPTLKKLYLGVIGTESVGPAPVAESSSSSSGAKTASKNSKKRGLEEDTEVVAKKARGSEASKTVPAGATTSTTICEGAGSSDSQTIHVSNFPFTASSEDIERHIRGVLADDSEFAVGVQSVELVRSKAGTSRGIARVTLMSRVAGPSDEVNKATQLLSQSQYEGRALNAVVVAISELPAAAVKSASSSHKVAPADAGSVAAPHLTTVFVSRLAASETSEQLREHFSQCGEVLSAKVSVDKKTGLSKCNGLVQFVDEAGRTNALKLHKSQWNDHEILVAPSRFSLVAVSHQTSTEQSIADTAPRVAETTNPTTATKQEASQNNEKKLPIAPASKLSVMSFKPRNVAKSK